MTSIQDDQPTARRTAVDVPEQSRSVTAVEPSTTPSDTVEAFRIARQAVVAVPA